MEEEKELYLNKNKRSLNIYDKGFEYSIIDDIIDFVPEESKENIDAYTKRA